MTDKRAKHCPHCGSENCKCAVAADDGGITLVCSVTGKVIGEGSNGR